MIKPFGDNILVESIRELQTKSGLWLPENKAPENIEEGIVISTGEGRKTVMGMMPVKVKKGDKIIYTHYSPRKIKHEDKEYMLISEDDVLAIIE